MVIITVIVNIKDRAVAKVALEAYGSNIAMVDLEGGVSICG